MDILLDRFLDLMEEATIAYKDLLYVLQKERKAIVNSNFQESNEAGKEKENILLKIRIVEEQRQNIQGKLADNLGYLPQDLTMTKLSESVQDPYSKRLKACCSSLSALLQSILEINSGNKALIMHCLELVTGSLTLLSNLMSTNPVYYRSGAVYLSENNGRVMSGRI
ncbi:MAG TPA: flagellar protein FlgN [Desulfobacteraceae bacterium]|nr:flagellar protein FlgN [Desulfobacteraceae bacterium]